CELVSGVAFSCGMILGRLGARAIGGALLNARVRELWGNETVVRGTFLVFALSVTAIAFSRQLWLSCLAVLPAGACWVLTLSLFNVTVQLSTPRWVVGRALALYQTSTFGGMAVGSWVWGMVAETHGTDNALIAFGVVLCLGAVIGLSYVLPEFGKLSLDPLDRFHEPLLQLDLRPRSGPIMVMVDYDIAQQDVNTFLALMAQRRRIRLRDGAR